MVNMVFKLIKEWLISRICPPCMTRIEIWQELAESFKLTADEMEGTEWGHALRKVADFIDFIIEVSLKANEMTEEEISDALVNFFIENPYYSKRNENDYFG